MALLAARFEQEFEGGRLTFQPAADALNEIVGDGLEDEALVILDEGDYFCRGGEDRGHT